MSRWVPALCAFGLGLAGAVVGDARTAHAQTDQVAQAHQAAANQLGVLEYCRGRGDVADVAIEAERRSIARLPPSSADAQPAEALGRGGTFSMGGTTTSLTAMASSRGVPVATVCKQMGDAAVQTDAAFSGKSGFGTMATPAMPPGMPAMPRGMLTVPPGMPAMPTMPPAR